MKIRSILVATALLSGCTVSSNWALRGRSGRTAFNKSVLQTANEQMLLNLVRLRYSDIPFFLDVGTITNQFRMHSGLGIQGQIPGFDSKNPTGVEAELAYESAPTIQYTPLKGHQFAQQLMEPIDLKVIQQLVYTGWDVERVFRLIVQSFNDIPNAPLAAGPTPDEIPEFKKFRQVTRLMRILQKEQKLQVGLHYGDNSQTLQVTYPINEVGEELAKLLKGSKIVRGHYHLDVPLGFNEDAEIGILPRSLLGCMYYLSLGVDVPPDEIEKGTAVIPGNGDNNCNFSCNEIIGNLMDIKYDAYLPADAYVAVRHRGLWYYISDHDVASKKTFVLLQQLYNLQSREPQTPPPLLTIPLI